MDDSGFYASCHISRCAFGWLAKFWSDLINTCELLYEVFYDAKEIEEIDTFFGNCNICKSRYTAKLTREFRINYISFL